MTKGQKPWRLKFRGYQHDDMLTQTVKTDAEGDGAIAVHSRTRRLLSRRLGRAVRTLTWRQVAVKRDRFLPPIKAETDVFVATNATTELGYRHGGVEIIVDKDTFRAGQTAPVMLSRSSQRSLRAVQRRRRGLLQLQAGPRHRNRQADRVADRREARAQHLSERGDGERCAVVCRHEASGRSAGAAVS